MFYKIIIIKSDATDSIIDRKSSERDKICLKLDSNIYSSILLDQGNIVDMEDEWQCGKRLKV